MDKRIEFMNLYRGLLRGLNLVQQKTWNEVELKKYFPDMKSHWRPLLEARHPKIFVDDSKKKAFDHLATMLVNWDEPVEAALLKRRLFKIDQYFTEVEKEHCDAESLNFFLQDFPLLHVESEKASLHFEKPSKKMSAEQARVKLDLELKKLFPLHEVSTILSSGTLARASTTKSGIRLREDVRFTKEEVEMLTVHEAWVHLGTNLAGVTQVQLPWLAQWHPGVTGFQEGLALIAEIATGHWHDKRELQVLSRHKAGIMALHGSDARSVWEFLCDQGLEKVNSLEMTLRIFRGCHLSGGMAFGKEFQYLLGLHQWLVRQEMINDQDMLIALSGKMDFLEWEILRSSALREKLLLPHPPVELVQWMNNSRVMAVQKRIQFKKVA
ncbi:MAG: flavohemoglobin expression-modulating QEGLA motif protein [Bacteriovoracaceae bacterium]|nr:flavohemoglobin expression-modulating QEGLA motif protein [Bacteriovoracaceae bacterium]